jgi:hypothetical protein
MDLRAESMADFLLEKSIHLRGWLHRSLQRLKILQLLPANQRTDRHDGTRKGPASFSSQGHSSGKRTPCLEDLPAYNTQLFLQSCKNGLCSPMEVQLILKRQFEYLIKQFFFFFHRSSFLKKFFYPILITIHHKIQTQTA